MQPPKAADASDAEPRPEEGGSEPGTGPRKPPEHLTGSTLSTSEDELSDRVSGDEPLLPARVHRPSDLLRLLIGVLAIVVLFAVAAFAHGTTAYSRRTSTRAPARRPICSSRSPVSSPASPCCSSRWPSPSNA